MGTLRETCVNLWYIAEFLLEWQVFKTKVVERTKHILFNQFFFKKNRDFYEKMWKNMVEPDGPQIQYNTAQRRYSLHVG